MAALKPEVKAFIIQSLACFDSLAIVAEAVQKKFGIKVTPQQIESHDPTKASGKGLAKKWVALFNSTRTRFQTEISDKRYIQYQQFNDAIRFPRYTYAELPDPAKTTYGMCFCTDTTRTPKMQMLYASNDGLWHPVNNPSDPWKPV